MRTKKLVFWNMVSLIVWTTIVVASLVMMEGCAQHVSPPPASKAEPNCATDASSVWVCTEVHVGSAPTIYIETFDVLATRESFDHKYKFSRPRKYESYITPDLYAPDYQSIPDGAALTVKDGNVFWHWSKATQ